MEDHITALLDSLSEGSKESGKALELLLEQDPDGCAT
jgi:hypothetical protein